PAHRIRGKQYYIHFAARAKSLSSTNESSFGARRFHLDPRRLARHTSHYGFKALANSVAQAQSSSPLPFLPLFLGRVDPLGVLEIDESMHAVGANQFDGNLHSHCEILVTADHASFHTAVERAHEGPMIGDAGHLRVERLPDPRAQFVRGDFL